MNNVQQFVDSNYAVFGFLFLALASFWMAFKKGKSAYEAFSSRNYVFANQEMQRAVEQLKPRLWWVQAIWTIWFLICASVMLYFSITTK